MRSAEEDLEDGRMRHMQQRQAGRHIRSVQCEEHGGAHEAEVKEGQRAVAEESW
jgi:hypothetical protein